MYELVKTLNHRKWGLVYSPDDGGYYWETCDGGDYRQTPGIHESIAKAVAACAWDEEIGF